MTAVVGWSSLSGSIVGDRVGFYKRRNFRKVSVYVTGA